ncbi:hypothetical protein [Mycobacterium sp. DL99]|nr:hypothetical protein [Mycobacterium sp. DL99]
MGAQLHADEVAALDHEPLDWRFKGIPAPRWGSDRPPGVHNLTPVTGPA